MGVNGRVCVSGHDDRLLAAVFGAAVLPGLPVEADFQPPIAGVMELALVFVVIDQALDVVVIAVAGKVRLVKGFAGNFYAVFHFRRKEEHVEREDVELEPVRHCEPVWNESETARHKGVFINSGWSTLLTRFARAGC